MHNQPRHHYTLWARFEAIVNRQPSHTALRFPDGKEYSYQELSSIAVSFSHMLCNKGLVAGDVVAIFNEKSVYGYGLMLACIRCGIIYTNLDVNSPWSRIGKILANCKPNLIVYDKNPTFIFEEIGSDSSGVEVLMLDEYELAITGIVEPQLSQNFHAENPAYIMFTSGSTGFPKGAAISHQNLLNFIEWGKTTFNVVETDVFSNANPIYFDNSVFDFYVSLFNGATLVPIDHDLAKQPSQLVKTINLAGCTIWFSVPSLLVYLLTTKALSKQDFPQVTRISFGGEGFPKNKLKKLYDLFADRIQLINVYGPTECTCICSSYNISDVDFKDMTILAPLGQMAPNFGYEILDSDNNRTNAGELCLTGPGVGLGYYNDEDRTSVSFVQNPHKPFNQVMYRTGDLVELKSDGLIHFKGRIDNQIKHMGYRIELEEIESAFSTLDYVDEVGVIYERITDELGHIKAYVSINKEGLSADGILNDVKKIVPAYMVPRILNILDVLPKNQNGKIDRKQLKDL